MFLFRLALALGRTVQELQHSVAQGELQEWKAFDLINPIGERWTQRAIQHAVVAIGAMRGANLNGNKLMPWLDDHPQPLGQDDDLTDDAHAAVLDRMMGL